MVEGHFTVFIRQIFFLHSSIDGHLGCLHVLTFVNSARTVLLIKNDDSLSLAKILSRNNSNILIFMNTNFKSMSYLISFLDLDGFLVSFYLGFVGEKKNVFIIKGKNTTYLAGLVPICGEFSSLISSFLCHYIHDHCGACLKLSECCILKGILRLIFWDKVTLTFVFVDFCYCKMSFLESDL